MSDGTVHTSIFRKPTHTDKYLDFRSHHPVSHKVSVIRTLYSRAMKLSTTSLLRTSEEEHIMKAVEENGYPQYLIQRVGRGCESRTSPVVSSEPKDQEPIAKITLPYIRSVSDSITRILRKLSICVSFLPHRTVWQSLVHVKDEIPEATRNGLPGIICGSNQEIALSTLQHAVFNGTKETSALAEHALTTGHNINWNNACVLVSCGHLNQRLYLESWYIQRQSVSLNRELGPLPPIYRSLIKQ